MSLSDNDLQELRLSNLLQYITPDTTHSDIWSECWDEDENPYNHLEQYAVIEATETKLNRDAPYASRGRYYSTYPTAEQAHAAFAHLAILHVARDDKRESWIPLAVVDLDTGRVSNTAVHDTQVGDQYHIHKAISPSTEMTREDYESQGWVRNGLDATYARARLDGETPSASGFVAWTLDGDNVRSWNAALTPPDSDETITAADTPKTFNFTVV